MLTSVVVTTGGLKGLKVNKLSGGLGTGGWRGTLCTAPVVWPRILRYQRIEGQLFLKSELNIRYRRIEGTDGNIAIAVWVITKGPKDKQQPKWGSGYRRIGGEH